MAVGLCGGGSPKGDVCRYVYACMYALEGGLTVHHFCSFKVMCRGEVYAAYAVCVFCVCWEACV